jgi:hypothetical protein
MKIENSLSLILCTLLLSTAPILVSEAASDVKYDNVANKIVNENDKNDALQRTFAKRILNSYYTTLYTGTHVKDLTEYFRWEKPPLIIENNDGYDMGDQSKDI